MAKRKSVMQKVYEIAMYRFGNTGWFTSDNLWTEEREFFRANNIAKADMWVSISRMVAKKFLNKAIIPSSPTTGPSKAKYQINRMIKPVFADGRKSKAELPDKFKFDKTILHKKQPKPQQPKKEMNDILADKFIAEYHRQAKELFLCQDRIADLVEMNKTLKAALSVAPNDRTRENIDTINRIKAIVGAE